MFKPFDCNMSTEELKHLYIGKKLTLSQMCEIVGCKSTITMRKILNNRGIDTNRNARTAQSKRGNRTDEQFKEYLKQEYIVKKRSMTSIARELNISWIIVSRYLDKYNLPKRTKSEQQRAEKSVNWHGGRNVASSGYIEIFCPDHPNANKRKYVYEHQLIAEKKIGRYLRKGEVVHHIDFNKQNNSIDNLVILNNSNHIKLHSLLKKGIDFNNAVKEVEIIEK